MKNIDVMMKRILLLLLFLPSLGQAKALCPQSVTTVEMNQCLSVKLERAVNELANNLDLIRLRHAQNRDLLALIEQAQMNWEAYRKKQCQTVYLMYEGGSIQSLMTASCSIQLARERNLILRETYLQSR
jgi:uncharacterized protein YecT (DUF1311 family)